MSTDPSTIQSYNKNAEAWAKDIRKGSNIAHEYLEKPAMYKILPNLEGKDILCIGCGTGEECAHLKSLGANRVVGIDISEGMIKQAKKAFPEIEFFVMDMEKLDFVDSTFDFVYSSLTFHYVQSWINLLNEINRVLKIDGLLQFSTTHPLLDNACKNKDENETSRIIGYRKNKLSKTIEIFGDYFNNEIRSDSWSTDFTISFFARPISQMTDELKETNFQIERIVEPKPLEAVKEVDLRFWESYSKLPLFILFTSKKIKSNKEDYA